MLFPSRAYSVLRKGDLYFMDSHFYDDYLVCDSDYAAVINQEVVPALQ